MSDAAIANCQVVPILRIFDVAKAKEFYVDYLGCRIDFEHRFEDGFPLYMQVSRGALMLHLTEHHGDATPGSTALIYVDEVDSLSRELSAKQYGYLRPRVEDTGTGAKRLQLTDPFGNRLRFWQRTKK